jgi:hypothetical protein
MQVLAVFDAEVEDVLSQGITFAQDSPLQLEGGQQWQGRKHGAGGITQAGAVAQVQPCGNK